MYLYNELKEHPDMEFIPRTFIFGAKAAAGYKSVIMIDNGTKKADAKRLMAIMGMGVKKGAVVTVTVEGEDEDTAFAAIEEFFKTNL